MSHYDQGHITHSGSDQSLVDEAHLLLHHVLVAADVSWPALHFVIIAQPDLIGDLVDQAEVVADEHQASIKSLNGISQRVDGLQVKMVGGLQVYRKECEMSIGYLTNYLL